MDIKNLLTKPLWQMTGEEFLFLSKSGTANIETPNPKVVDVTSPKYVYGLSGIAKLFAKGRYAEIEKENKRLTAENEEMKTQVAEMEDKVAKIPMVDEKKPRKNRGNQQETSGGEGGIRVTDY